MSVRSAQQCRNVKGTRRDETTKITPKPASVTQLPIQEMVQARSGCLIQSYNNTCRPIHIIITFQKRLSTQPKNTPFLPKGVQTDYSQDSQLKEYTMSLPSVVSSKANALPKATIFLRKRASHRRDLSLRTTKLGESAITLAT